MADPEMRLFHNRLRVMRSIDLADLNEAGVDGRTWDAFRDDPYAWFIRASDADVAKVWGIIANRAPAIRADPIWLEG